MLENSSSNALAPSYISKQVFDSRYFFRNFTSKKDNALELLSVGRESCLGEYKIERKHFDYYAIEFVLAGRFSLTLGKKKYNIKPGSIFAYTPSTYHKIESQKDETSVKYFVDFWGTEASKLIKDSGLDKAPVNITDLERCMEIFEFMLDCVKYGENSAAEISSNLLKILSLLIKENSRKLSKNDSSYNIYFNCRTYISKNFAKILKMNDVAKQCGVSSAYLSRLFQKYSSENPYKFLNRLKMNKAGQYLLNENKTVKETASEVGFDDQYHFSKAFKKFYGISPSEFKGF